MTLFIVAASLSRRSRPSLNDDDEVVGLVNRLVGGAACGPCACAAQAAEVLLHRRKQAKQAQLRREGGGAVVPCPGSKALSLSLSRPGPKTTMRRQEAE